MMADDSISLETLARLDAAMAACNAGVVGEAFDRDEVSGLLSEE